jgi:hypothetical protein
MVNVAEKPAVATDRATPESFAVLAHESAAETHKVRSF